MIQVCGDYGNGDVRCGELLLAYGIRSYETWVLPLHSNKFKVLQRGLGFECLIASVLARLTRAPVEYFAQLPGVFSYNCKQ